MIDYVLGSRKYIAWITPMSLSETDNDDEEVKYQMVENETEIEEEDMETVDD